MGPTPLANTPYLVRRRGNSRSGNRFYIRVPVPHDLQHVFGRHPVMRALKTSDFDEAKRRMHGPLAEIHAAFARARQDKITSADIEHEAQRYLRERITVLQKIPGDTFKHSVDSDGRDYGPGALPYLDELTEGLTEGLWEPRVAKAAADIAARYGNTLTPDAEDELCRALQIAELEAVKQLLSIEEGIAPQPVGTLNARAVDPISGTVRQPIRPAPSTSAGIRIHDAGEVYIADRNRNQRGAWTAQTRNQTQATFRLFEEFTRNAPLPTITRANVAAFLSTLSRLHPNYGRHSGTGKMTLAMLLQKCPASEGAGLSNRTLNRHAAAIAGMFEWAIREGKYQGSNPAKGHYRSEGAHDDQEPARRTFTTDELKKLFAGSLFQTPNAERIRPAKHTAPTALAWLIPIALFSGMRLDEICGLRVADVKEAEGILHFDITSHEGRRLKTAAARRLVPIHPELLRIGFASYLDYVKGQGHEFLFPGLRPGGPDSKPSWYIGRRFTDYRRAVGVSAKETTFHCFRKNVSTALERARIPEAEAARIVGHRLDTMTYGLYSGGLDLPGLQRVVEAIQYAGLDLSRLYPERPGWADLRGRQPRSGQSQSPATSETRHIDG